MSSSCERFFVATGAICVVGMVSLLSACSVVQSVPDADDDPAKTPTLVVTGSRIPHKVPGGKPTGVKTISREGFEEDMKGNQMPHRQGG